MRLTYLANIRFPNEKAHGIQLAKMCEAFVKEGVELTLVVPRIGMADDPFSFYGLSSGFQIVRLWTTTIGRNTRFGFLLSSFLFGFSSLLYILRSRPQFIYSIDIDHISFWGFPFLHIPYFFEFHGPKRNIWLIRRLLLNITGIFAVSDILKKELHDVFRVPENKIIVCPNGVDTERYAHITSHDARKKLRLPLKQKIVIYTGSFQGWKGIETIVNAAQNLPHVHFYLVGGTNTDLRRIGILNIPHNVHVAGKKTFLDMPLWQISADILLVTGTKKDRYSYTQTSPMKLFEYMASERPIIASGTPAIKQVVTESEVFFHEPDNADDLRRTIESVLTDSVGAQKKADIAHTHAQSLSWKKRAKKIIGYIEERI